MCAGYGLLFALPLYTAVALAACSESPTRPTPIDPITPMPERSIASVVFSDLDAVEAGKLSSRPLTAEVHDPDGHPVADAMFRWEADSHAGWVFPPEGRTTAEGRITADWVAGDPGAGRLALTVRNGVSEFTAEVRTQSVASPSPPWSAHSVWVRNQVRDPTGIAIDLTPLTEPAGTYYSALNWDGGYTGLQRAGSRYDRQLQFSVWDSPAGDAEVIRRGAGLQCRTFGNEGTGKACELSYSWRVGSTYRFEVEWAELRGGTEVTLHVTDLSAGERRFIGTLRDARPIDRGRDIAWFVEDFRRNAPTCLEQPVRQAAFQRALAKSGGSWHPLTSGYFGYPANIRDMGNPGTSSCVNVRVENHPSGIATAIGGRTAMDPRHPTRVTIP